MFDSLLFWHIPSAASEPVTTTFCVRFHSPSSMLKSYCSFNPFWTMKTAIFQERSNLYHILEPIFGGLFQKIILGCFRSSFIDPFSFAKKRCNTVLAPYPFSHVMDYFPFFPFSFFSRSVLIFTVTSDWVLSQLRVCIAYKFNFQRKRNELQLRRLERGVSKYGSLKNEYSRASSASYTFQLLMSFWLHIINPLSIN